MTSDSGDMSMLSLCCINVAKKALKKMQFKVRYGARQWPDMLEIFPGHYCLLLQQIFSFILKIFS